MKQLDLLDALPLARRTDPETSHGAADRMAPLARADRVKVLLAHYGRPCGLTDFELAASLERQQTSVGKRRGELRDAGYIEATEIRRPAPSGSAAIVWRITEAGMAAVREIVSRGTSP
jgi:hypothetical protein